MSGAPAVWFSSQDVAGVRLHVLTTRKFRVESARLVVRLPLTPGDVTASALVPYVLRRGTSTMPTTQAIARHLEEMYGARVAAEVGKVGDVQLVELRAEAVADEDLPGERRGVEQLEGVLSLLFEMLFDPVTKGGAFVPEYVDQEKDILRRRIEGIINNKRQYAVHRLFEEMYRGEPFALHRLGRLEDLPGIDREGLFRHYRERVLAHPADLVVVSREEAGTVAQTVSRVAGRLGVRPTAGAGEIRSKQVAPGRPAGGKAQGFPRQVEEKEDVKQAVLALGYRSPLGFDSPEYPAMVVYSGILGGFPHSKLFTQVREKNSLAYFVYSRQEAARGAVVISAGVDPQKREQAVAIIQEQLLAMARGDITDDEMDATKKALVRRYRVGEDDPGSLIDQFELGLVLGTQRPFSELAGAVEGIDRDAVVKAAATVSPDTLYFLTSKDSTPSAVPQGGHEGGVA